MSPTALELGSKVRGADQGLGTIPYDSGNPRSIRIPRGALLRGIVVRLTGALVVGTAAATIFSLAPLGLIKQIELSADGNRTVIKEAGRRLFRLAHFYQQKQGEISPPVAGVGTNAFSATIYISNEALRMVRPQESYYDTRDFTETDLTITWGAATDIANAGGGGTIAISATTVADVQTVIETVGEADILFDRVIVGKESDVTASNGNFQIEVPKSGLLAAIMFETTRIAAVGPVPVDNIINFISLQSDNGFYHRKKLDYDTLQRRNVQEYQLDGGASAGAQIPGYALLDFAVDGMKSSLLNTYALQDPTLELDVTRTSDTEKVNVSFLFYQPRAVAA
jgi:hypothetical protein